MTNLDGTLKSRDITLLTKVCIVKAMDFPVVMYGSESWTIKKTEHHKTKVEKQQAIPIEKQLFGVAKSQTQLN